MALTKPRVTDRDRDEIKQLTVFGMTSADIAKSLRRSKSTIQPLVAAIVAEEGPLPPCRCGKVRSHRGPCGKLRKKHQGTRLAPRAVTNIYALAKVGWSARRIAPALQIGLSTVLRYMSELVQEEGPLPPCPCGRALHHPGGCRVNSPSTYSPEKIEQIERLIRAGHQVNTVARMIGGRFHAVAKYAGRVIQQMLEEGLFCGCGRPLGHRHICTVTYGIGKQQRGPVPLAEDLHRRVTNALFNGDALVDIRRNLTVSERNVYRVLRTMDPLDRKRRSMAVWARMGERDAVVMGKDLMARISAAIGRHVEPSLRDEVLSEMWLAIGNSEITTGEIEAKVKGFVSRAYGTWASRYRSRSLDESMGDDDERTLGDLLDDEIALDQFNDIAIGAHW